MLALLVICKRCRLSPVRMSCIDVFISIKPRQESSTLFCHGAMRIAREFRAALPRVAVRESLRVLITLRRDDVSWHD
jgi:hypothetical protein